MKINIILAGKHQISEVISKDIVIKNTQDALDLMGEIQTDHILLYENNFEKDFFDLSTGKLGEIFQKFTNYRVKIAIIGTFDKYTSKALKDFIYESNKHGEYLFLSSMEEVIERWKN